MKLNNHYDVQLVKPLILLGGLVLLLLVISLFLGAVPVHWQDVWSPSGQSGAGSFVLWKLRFPRIVFSLLIGSTLGLTGALAQGLFRNPLADPGLLGVTSGAACAVAVSIVFLGVTGVHLPAEWRFWSLPVMAFVGAIVVCFVLDRIARWLTAGSIAGLLLTGIALNALTAAVIGLCSYLSTDEQLRSLNFWMLGSLASATWAINASLVVLLVIALLYIRRLIGGLNALALGESTAMHIGVDVNRLRTQVIFAVAVLSGFAVAWCGMIGFIGLIAPHIVRVLFGADQRQVVPLSMGVGAILLIVADTLARTIAIPAEIPVGIFTSLFGAPFFFVLLLRLRYKG